MNMPNEALGFSSSENAGTSSTSAQEFLTVFIGGQRFGIPILQIQDVLGDQSVTFIPLSPPEVAGSLNLRGRVVTAIDVRRRLNMDTAQPHEQGTTQNMSVVVEHHHELYSLIIDKVGDALVLENALFEKNPATLDAVWQDVSTGIFRLDDELLVILDVPKLLESIQL